MNEPYRPSENMFRRVGPVHDRTYRKKVPGGWIVKIDEYYSTKTTWGAICFYPDPNHEWKDLAECSNCHELVDVEELSQTFFESDIAKFGKDVYVCNSCREKEDKP